MGKEKTCPRKFLRRTAMIREMAFFSFKRLIYERLPLPAKAMIGCVRFRWLAGRSYRQTIRRGKRIEHASREDVLCYQGAALRRMLEFACDQVPAYRSLRSTVERLPPFEALRAFPLLDKESLQQNI